MCGISNFRLQFCSSVLIMLNKKVTEMIKFENGKISGKHFAFNLPDYCCRMEFPTEFDGRFTAHFITEDNVKIVIKINENNCIVSDYRIIGIVFKIKELEHIKEVKRGNGTGNAIKYKFEEPLTKQVYEETYKIDCGEEQFGISLNIFDNGHKKPIDKVLKHKTVKSFLGSVEYF